MIGTLTSTARGQAAVAYFLYGVVYMGGAIGELDASRMRRFVAGTVPWWAFYVLGGVFIVVLPILVAKGYRYLALVLAILTGAKSLYLFYGLGRGFSVFNSSFALVALAASMLLVRAFLRPHPASQ